MAASKYNSSEPSFVAQSFDTMHSSVKAFLEMNSVSYVRLGELDLAELHQLCCASDSDEHGLSSPTRDN